MSNKNYENVQSNLQFIVKKYLNTFIHKVIGGLVGGVMARRYLNR